MSKKGNSGDVLRCSFCNKSQRDVKKLIAGPTVYICDECVDICLDIIAEDRKDEPGALEGAGHLPKPKEIKEFLDLYVIGQERAMKKLAVAVYNHYKRIDYQSRNTRQDVELQKSNILLIGPTGTGKTLLAQVHPEDLIKFGLIPEFVGRLPVVATLSELDRAALIEILREPKNSLVRQYQTIMGFENVELRFTDDALEAIAEEALKRNVGARGLKIIIEELMLEIMYTIPSEHTISECVITREVVDNRAQPVTVYKKAG